MAMDYFISHASEDKLAVAEPLARYLADSKFKVWYDDFSLKLGDSLLASIDRGLAEARFGITILSQKFFDKKWPNRELAGLVAIEGKRKRILPVWHNISAASVAKFSPILADRKAIDSARGLQAVAEAIVVASFPKRIKNLPHHLGVNSAIEQRNWEDSRKRFKDLLDHHPSVADIRAFVSVNHSLILELGRYRSVLIPGFLLPAGLICDFAILRPHGVTGPIELELVILGPLDKADIGHVLVDLPQQFGPRSRPPREPYNYSGGTLLGEFPQLDAIGAAVRKLAHSDNIHFEASDWWLLRILVISGRRAGRDPEQLDLSELPVAAIEVASYDRLLDDEQPTRIG